MKAIAVFRPRRVCHERVELPPLEDGQVLVRVKACAICGSDLRYYREGHRPEGSFGHEFTGTIEDVCGESGGLKLGDTVATGLAGSCGGCRPCLLGHPNFCEFAQSTYFPGGLAERCIVSNCGEAQTLVKLPTSLPLRRATLHEPVSCALRIARRAEVRHGDRVAIIGLGTMGLLSALVLKHLTGEVELVGFDHRKERRGIAERCGLGVGETDEAGEFDVVIDATGDAAAFSGSLELARLGGTVVLAGVPEGTIPLSPLPIFRKELDVRGAKGPFPYLTKEGRSEALEVLGVESIPWDLLIRSFPFGQAEAAFQAVDTGAAVKAVLVMDDGQNTA